MWIIGIGHKYFSMHVVDLTIDINDINSIYMFTIPSLG